MQTVSSTTAMQAVSSTTTFTISDAVETVSGFFNAHARHDNRIGKPVLFTTDVNGTLDADPNLDLLLVAVLGMGERLQDIVTDVKVVTGDVTQKLNFAIVDLLKARESEEWLVDKMDICKIGERIEVAFEDDKTLLKMLKTFGEMGAYGTCAAVDPASDECKDLLSAWRVLGQTDEGIDARDQVFQAWYNGPQPQL